MQLNKKNKYLILGTLVMLFLSYQLALKKTWVLKNEYEQKLLEQHNTSNANEQLAYLHRKEKALNKKLLDLNINDTSIENNLLKFLHEKCLKQEVKLIQFKAPHVSVNEKGKIITHIFQLEGKYTGILKVLNAIENNGSFGAVEHLSYDKKKDLRKKRSYLTASVFLNRIQ
jgi:hypothetical protein